MARLKELKIWKMRENGRFKTFVRLEFCAGKRADPENFPTGVIFQKGYISNRNAERKLNEIRAIWGKDLINEEGTWRRLSHGYFEGKREAEATDALL